ncbi:uncharacterized protein LOC109398999 [Aedes albopictus]|uniref:Secreted protein n=1 Tax=Aedes albopictus TaxID=7160 RepID=A0ABM1Z0U1_AEDAL
MRVLAGFVLLLATLQASLGFTLPRERRQSSSSSVMAIGEDGDRAAIPGLSEIQTAIQVAQFLINVGQQVLPAILQSLAPPMSSEGTRMDEMQLIQMVRQRMMMENSGGS